MNFPQKITDAQKNGKKYIVWDTLAKDWFAATYKKFNGLTAWYTYPENYSLLNPTHFVELLPIADEED